MKRVLMRILGASLMTLTLAAPHLALADETKKAESADAHAGHAHVDDKVYKGYFDDAAVKARPFSDYEGDWQSLYPYLQDGSLDPVWEEKSKAGDKTAAEYKAYYDVGYKTDVSRITINGDDVTFYRGDQKTSGTYQTDGHEILTYKKGNRGVRFIYKKTSGDEAAPAFIQFSDHKIAPSKADHYHIYWGNDRAALLNEVTNWPTYYPSDLKSEEIVEEMLAH
jgi:zinc transport system substrate-binding protein